MKKKIILAGELWSSYMQGWKDGAVMRPVRNEFSLHKTRPDIATKYQLGYFHGKEARKSAGRGASILFGYYPIPLREEEE